MSRTTPCSELTYGDGVADIDIAAQLSFHRAHGKLATVTAVQPPKRFGAMELDNDRILAFAEKPESDRGWINGGFFLLSPKVDALIEGDATVWEHEPMNRLVAQGQMRAYRHHGFWHPMDTLRDKMFLEEEWKSGKPKWRSVVITSGFWSGRRVFLTGHTGFKGSWLGLMLARLNAQVTALRARPFGRPASL